MANMSLNVNFSSAMQSLLDIQSQAQGQTLARGQQSLQIQADSERASFQHELQKKQFGNGAVKKSVASTEASAQKVASSTTTTRSAEQQQPTVDESSAVKQETVDAAATSNASPTEAKASGQSSPTPDTENAAGEEQAGQGEEALLMMTVSLPSILLPQQPVTDEAVDLTEEMIAPPLVETEIAVPMQNEVDSEAPLVVMLDDGSDTVLQEEAPVMATESFASALQEAPHASLTETPESDVSAEGAEEIVLQSVDLEQNVPIVDSTKQLVRAEGKHPGIADVENSDMTLVEADVVSETDVKSVMQVTEQSEQSSSLSGREASSSLRATDRQQTAEIPVQNQWNFAQIMAEQQVETQVTVSNVVRPSGSTIISQVDQLLQTMEASHLSLQEGRVTEMEVTLQPRNLGKLVLKLEMENNELRAYFNTQSQIVKQALESQMGDLRDLLQQQGLNVSQLSVQVGNQQQTNQSSSQRTSKSGGQSGGVGGMNAVEGDLPIQRVDELWHRMAGNRLSIRI